MWEKEGQIWGKREGVLRECPDPTGREAKVWYVHIEGGWVASVEELRAAVLTEGEVWEGIVVILLKRGTSASR